MGAGGVLRRVVFLAVLTGSAGAAAQDQRAVAEPKVPPICKILYAELQPVNGVLPEGSVERHYRDNARLVKAMAGCGAGKSVVLHSNKNGRQVFLIGPLQLKAGVTLVVEQGAALWGSRDPREYDVAPGSCGIVGAKGAGCKPLLLADETSHSGVMGGGVIDGRGGAKLLGQTETWWQLARRAKVEDLNQAVPMLLVVRRSSEFTLYGITLRNSPGCHVTTEQVNGFTAWGVKIDTARWARGTDGIDPRWGTTNVTIVDTYIRAGDDNISVTAGGSEAVPVTHVTARGVHFYQGRGFGVGSEGAAGVSAVRVEGLTIDGSEYGLRIKGDRSHGGAVEDVRFENVCMRGVRNPIVLTPMYTAAEGGRPLGTRGVVLRNVRSLEDGVQPSVMLTGTDASHRLEATLENVVIEGLKAEEVTARHAQLTVRHGNVEAAGEDVHVNGGSGGGAAYGCEAEKFLVFPEEMLTPRPAELVPEEDGTLYVAADGTGDYTSIQAAMKRIPAAGGVVMIAPGVYRERVLVRQPHVTLRSANADARKTVIVSSTQRGGGATVVVRGDDFRAENLTFQNEGQPERREGGPADAPAFNIGSDRNVIRNVRMLGGVHTAYFGAKNCNQSTGSPCEAGRTLVEDSYIAGSVDFIYGDGLVYFRHCELHSIEHGMEQGASGFITGQGKHYATQPSAFVFRNSLLTADAGVTNVFLGEPWRDLSTVIFLEPQIGSHIGVAGFRERQPSGAGRMATSYFRVYHPAGSATSARLLTAQEAAAYGVKEVLAGADGWNPLGTQ